jgi:hypothetical protein
MVGPTMAGLQNLFWLTSSMTPTIFCNQLIGRWQLTIAWYWYLLICFGITVFARAFQSLFKAQALMYQAAGEGYKLSEVEKSQGYWHLYGRIFFGFWFGEHSDLLLPTLIGFIELAAYPVLFVIGQYLFIGAWLGIKTAGSWTGWRKSPTAYNRFLVFNLLNLIVAYFLLTRFVLYTPCP